MVPEDAAMHDAVVDAGMSDDEDSFSGSDAEGDALKDVSESDVNMMMELEGRLEGNPNLYDAHVQLIEVLRRCKMRERLREARHAMHARFPLAEAMWYDWVADELEGVEGPDDIPRIAELFETALKDYLSVGLWCQYIEFVRDFDPGVQARSQEGLQRMRGLCERALTTCGLHVTEGGRVWALYRGFEEALEAEQAGEAAAERVRALFHRQLAVPLSDGPDTLAAYQRWVEALAQAVGGPQEGAETEGQPSSAVPRQLRRAYDFARRAVELRQPYEAAVAVAGGMAPDTDLLAAYMAYIKVEVSGGEPARVQLLYERALAVFPVTHHLWLQYGRYVEAQLHDARAAGVLYARAARNCPWVGEVWARGLRAAERAGVVDPPHAEMYAAALAAGLQGGDDYVAVALARADALRRRGPGALPQLRELFSSVAALLSSYYPDYHDPGLRLTAYWANCEVKAAGGDMEAARAVWEAAVKSSAGRHAEAWLAYAEMERRAGEVAAARAVYRRCYTRQLASGGQAAVCQAWVRFEREEGSAEDHLAACIKAEPLLEEAAAAALAAADAEADAGARAAAERAPKPRPPGRDEAKKLRQQADPNFKRRQRGASEAGDGGAPPPRAKKPRTKEREPQVAAEAQQRPQGKKGKPQPETEMPVAGAAMPPPPPKQKRQRQQQQQQQQQVEPDATVEQPRLLAEVPQPAPQHAAQQPAPQHEAQQLQPEPEPPSQAEQAPGGEQQLQDAGRGQQAARKPGERKAEREALTAFVKHLAADVDEAALRQLFGACGPLKKAKLSKNPATGQHKGFAYVEFTTAEDLQRACALSDTEFHGKRLFVAPSAPPGTAGTGGGGGGGRGAFEGGAGRDGLGGRGGGRGRGPRSKLDFGAGGEGAAVTAPPRGAAFVPRAAVLQRGAGAAAGSAAGPGKPAAKSNADFRNMLLNGGK